VDTELITERVARNQSTFRDANEQLEERAAAIGVNARALPFICDCPDPDCTTVALIAREEYERIRSRGAWFFAVPGHEVCIVDGVDVAKIVERRDAYSLMEKVGEAKAIVEQLDPRS
jgi:hypothetical protein